MYKSNYLIYSIDKLIRFITPYIVIIIFSADISDNIIYINSLLMTLTTFSDMGSSQYFSIINTKLKPEIRGQYNNLKILINIGLIAVTMSIIISWLTILIADYQYKYLILVLPFFVSNRINASINKSYGKSKVYFIFEFLLPSILLLISCLFTYLIKSYNTELLASRVVYIIVIIWILLLSICNIIVLDDKNSFSFQNILKLIQPLGKQIKLLKETVNKINVNPLIFIATNSLPYINSLIQFYILINFFPEGSLTSFSYVIMIGSIPCLYQTVVNQREQINIGYLQNMESQKEEKSLDLFCKIRRESYFSFLILQLAIIVITICINYKNIINIEIPINYVLIVSSASFITVITGPSGNFLQMLGKETLDFKLSTISIIIGFLVGIITYEVFGLIGIYIWYSFSIFLNNYLKYISNMKYFIKKDMITSHAIPVIYILILLPFILQVSIVTSICLFLFFVFISLILIESKYKTYKLTV